MARRSHSDIFPGHIKICARPSPTSPPVPVYFNGSRIYFHRAISNFSFRTDRFQDKSSRWSAFSTLTREKEKERALEKGERVNAKRRLFFALSQRTVRRMSRKTYGRQGRVNRSKGTYNRRQSREDYPFQFH